MHEEALEPESRYEASVTQLKGRCQDPWLPSLSVCLGLSWCYHGVPRSRKPYGPRQTEGVGHPVYKALPF